MPTSSTSIDKGRPMHFKYSSFQAAEASTRNLLGKEEDYDKMTPHLESARRENDSKDMALDEDLRGWLNEVEYTCKEEAAAADKLCQKKPMHLHLVIRQHDRN